MKSFFGHIANKDVVKEVVKIQVKEEVAPVMERRFVRIVSFKHEFEHKAVAESNSWLEQMDQLRLVVNHAFASQEGNNYVLTLVVEGVRPLYATDTQLKEMLKLKY